MNTQDNIRACLELWVNKQLIDKKYIWIEAKETLKGLNEKCQQKMKLDENYLLTTKNIFVLSNLLKI